MMNECKIVVKKVKSWVEILNPSLVGCPLDIIH